MLAIKLGSISAIVMMFSFLTIACFTPEPLPDTDSCPHRHRVPDLHTHADSHAGAHAGSHAAAHAGSHAAAHAGTHAAAHAGPHAGTHAGTGLAGNQ